MDLLYRVARRSQVPGALVLLMVSAVSAQAPAPRNGAITITGQVVDGVSGKPISAAVVVISGDAFGGRTGSSVATPTRLLTGGDGRFVFARLPSGSYTISATKGGYAEGASGRRRPGGSAQSIALTDSQGSAETAIRLWRNGVIAGTVTDEAGEAVVGVALRALARTFTGGRRHFAPGGAAVTTDDRGMYRFSSLAPGDYLVITSPPTVAARANIFTDIARTGRGSGEIVPIVSGTPNGIQVGDTLISLGRGGVIPPPPVGGHLQVYPSTFYPSAFMPAQATTITLGAGEERSGIDIQLQPVTTVRMSGTLIGSSGPASMATVRLVPAGVEDLADGLAPATFTDASGAFTFPAVVPGQYSLRSTVRENPQGLLWVDMPITISGDVDGVAAIMRPGLRVNGRLEFEGTTPRPAGSPQRSPLRVSIALERLDAAMAAPLPVSWNEEGFSLSGFSAGKYLVRVSGSPVGWMFKSALLNGVDVSETPFELTRDVTDLILTFTDRWSGLGGSVQGAGADGAAVVVFPTDPQGWIDCGTNPRRLRNTRVTAQGRFGISSLPAGDYYVLATPEEQTAEWRDPRTLEALARVANRITILEGEHLTIDLPVREAKQ